MTTARQAQLERLIAINARQIAEMESRLLEILNADEMHKAFELAAELQVTKLDLRDLLEGESAGNNSPSAH